MDDTDYKKQRTSLILISMAIILYVLGEGHIGTKGGIFGGTIIFAKPEILEKAGLIIYLWLNWRYAISCKPFIHKFGNHYRYFLYTSDTYKKYITNNLNTIKEKASTANHINNFIGSTILWNPKGNGTLPPLIKNLFWPNKLFYNKNTHTISTTAVEEVAQGNIVSAFPKPEPKADEIMLIPAPFLKLVILEAAILFRVAWGHKPFSDIIAPIIISIYAAYLLVIKQIC